MKTRSKTGIRILEFFSVIFDKKKNWSKNSRKYFRKIFQEKKFEKKNFTKKFQKIFFHEFWPQNLFFIFFHHTQKFERRKYRTLKYSMKFEKYFFPKRKFISCPEIFFVLFLDLRVHNSKPCPKRFFENFDNFFSHSFFPWKKKPKIFCVLGKNFKQKFFDTLNPLEFRKEMKITLEVFESLPEMTLRVQEFWFRWIYLDWMTKQNNNSPIV